MAKEARVFCAYRLPKETKEAIKVLADRLKESESNVIVRAISEFIPGDPKHPGDRRPIRSDPDEPLNTDTRENGGNFSDEKMTATEVRRSGLQKEPVVTSIFHRPNRHPIPKVRK